MGATLSNSTAEDTRRLLASANSGSLPTITPQPNAGTTATAAVIAGVASNNGGWISVTSNGTGQAGGGDLVKITLASTPPQGIIPMAIAQAPPALALGALSITGVTANSFNIACQNAPVAGVTYQFFYTLSPVGI